MPFGQPIIELESVESTNNYVANLLRTSNVAEGTVVLSRFQSQGRGQRGTSWQSEPGANVLASIVLRPSRLSAAEQFRLNQAVCLGLVEGLAQAFGLDAVIKWPNDILVDGHKLAGILIECALRGQKVDHAIVGVGMNVNQTQFGEGVQATSLRSETRLDKSPREVLELLLPHLERRYAQLSDADGLEADYLQRLWGYQQPLFYRADGEVFRGVIVGLGAHGELRLETDSGAQRAFGFKSISLVGKDLG